MKHKTRELLYSLTAYTIAILGLILIASLTGCATTERHVDECKAHGGVWYKGPMDSEYTCVDRFALGQALERL